MFPVMYSPMSNLFILAPSYNPLVERYVHEVGGIARAIAGLRHHRGDHVQSDGSAMKSLDLTDHCGDGPGVQQPIERPKCLSGTRGQTHRFRYHRRDRQSRPVGLMEISEPRDISLLMVASLLSASELVIQPSGRAGPVRRTLEEWLTVANPEVEFFT